MKAEYTNLLENSFQIEFADRELTRLEFLSMNIFDFTTYDGDMDIFLAKKALDVCKSINDKTTFEYQKDNYIWYITMVNMPFFNDKLEWGTSIRGAWWDTYRKKPYIIDSCGLWKDDEQVLNMQIKPENWPLFIEAMIDFEKIDLN